MKLAIDASNIKAGGGIVYLQNLLQYADPYIHDIQKVVVYGGRKPLENLPQKNWLDLREIPILNRSFLHRLQWQKSQLGRIVKQEKALLFVPGGLYLERYLPFVTMFQNMQVFEKPEKNREYFSKAWLRLHLLQIGQSKTFSNCSGLILLSEHSQNYLRQFYPYLLKDSQVSIIPHGISQIKKQPRDYEFKHKIRLLYVSTVKQYKHQWQLIEAVACLKKQGFPIELHLIGSCDRPALKRMNEAIQNNSSLGEFVKYYGELSHNETLNWYENVDLFAFPSSCEALPIILLEAMAAGLPIACSDRGPMPEVLQDAGIYFNPDQQDSIAESLKLLLKDKSLRKNLGIKARLLSKKFSWERCAHETFSFLGSINKLHFS